jgi:hypothetical protein
MPLPSSIRAPRPPSDTLSFGYTPGGRAHPSVLYTGLEKHRGYWAEVVTFMVRAGVPRRIIPNHGPTAEEVRPAERRT